MARALELAEKGRFTVSPNPMVGCVIVRDGAIIAEGWHQRAGEAHAEIAALQHCEDARGATMYVSLEPCSHHGRTPPCVDRVIASGVTRVVIAMEDPHERVNGQGVRALRDAGIDVEVGVRETEARRRNEKFVWSIRQKLPFVLLKAAMTLDGKLATQTGESQWITSEESRQRSLEIREEYDAILVGSGTVRADNPRLTRRLGIATTPWTRVVLDGDGEVDPHAQLFSGEGRTILFTSRPERHENSHAVEIIATEGRVDLERVLGELYQRGIHSLIVEGGAVVLAELIRRALWQKMILFVAPALVGGATAPSLLSNTAVARLTDAYRFRFDRCDLVGGDLMITAYPA
jgi:diaminohydroxyphosphoribosylaminopyrimidine deaminase/5-amino-6-(5-phosphoribosylamino)uracil reductase